MYNGNKVAALVQARMTSSRLPGKVLLDLAGKPVLQHIIERLRRSQYIDDIIIATTTNEADDPIISLCENMGCNYFRGSEEDVLQRVLDAAHAFKANVIVEVTGDCPCVCPQMADFMIENLNNNDYVSNVINRTFPRGLDIQVFYTNTLKRVNCEVDNSIDRQHVSSWIYKNPKNLLKYKTKNIVQEKNYSDIRLTLDTKEDYFVLQQLFNAMDDFAEGDIIRFVDRYPELFTVNSCIPQKNYYKELFECTMS